MLSLTASELLSCSLKSHAYSQAKNGSRDVRYCTFSLVMAWQINRDIQTVTVNNRHPVIYNFTKLLESTPIIDKFNN